MALSSRRNPAKKRKQDTPIVVPVHEPRPLTDLEEAVSFEKTASVEAKQAYNEYFSKCRVWLERGIDFEAVGKEVKEFFADREWMEIALERTDNINVTMVAEFYVVLSTYDPKTIGDLTYFPLRTVNVTFHPVMINAFYGLPEMPDEEDYYTVWNLGQPATLQAKAYEAQQAFDPSATWIDNIFAYGRCIRDIRAIKQFLGHNVSPSTHVCAYGRDDVVIAWAMVNDIPINLGKLIFSKACILLRVAFDRDVCRSLILSLPCVLPLKFQFYPQIESCLHILHSLVKKSTALPAGTINYNNPNRQQQPPPPQTRAPPLFPQASRQPQPIQSHNSQVEAMFQHIIQAQARTDANIALGFERNRQWAEDLRIGQKGHRAFISSIDPRFADISDAYPQSQPDPYTLPDWIPPISPPVIFQDYILSSVGQGGMFTGTSDTSMGMGGVTSVSDVTAGLGSMGLEGSVTMTTMQTQTTFQASTSVVPPQFSYGLHTTQFLGTEFTTSGPSGTFSAQFDSS